MAPISTRQVKDALVCILGEKTLNPRGSDIVAISVEDSLDDIVGLDITSAVLGFFNSGKLSKEFER